jgi:hypothetical protein
MPRIMHFVLDAEQNLMSGLLNVLSCEYFVRHPAAIAVVFMSIRFVACRKLAA